MNLADLGDDAALRAATNDGTVLATIISMTGSFSRRLGAQLAIRSDGSTVGDLADGCLEAALVRAAHDLPAGARRRIGYGGHDGPIDQRLACGGTLDIMIDTAPDRAVIGAAVAMLDARQAVRLTIPTGAAGQWALADAVGPGGFTRAFIPSPRLLVLGAGPEVDALATLAASYGLAMTPLRPHGHPGGTLSLNQEPAVATDPWTAILILFHDHEWERTLIPWAIATPAFYIGAQGGAMTRAARRERLVEHGLAVAAAGRLHSPVGLITQARDARVLALSALAEVVAAYERLPR